jgi:hypothetical protein
MSKAASHFRENDVKRLVRSVERAGVKIGRVELQGGKVVLSLKMARPRQGPSQKIRSDGEPCAFD